jgi:hypothetical protein
VGGFFLSWSSSVLNINDKREKRERERHIKGRDRESFNGDGSRFWLTLLKLTKKKEVLLLLL